MRPFAVLVVGTVSLLVAERASLACAVCASGDATMRSREAARPSSGVFGAAVDVRAGALSALGSTRLAEVRTEGSVHVAPTEGVRLRLAVPVLARSLVTSNGDEGQRVVPGDVTPSVDVSVSETRDGRLSRSTAVTLGIALPTAPATRDARGGWLPSMLQPGCNAIVPEALVSYRLSWRSLSFSASPRARLPLPVREAPHRGAMIALALGAQAQPHPRFAARLGLVARYELEGADARGAGDGVSGGFVGYVAPEVAVRPTMDLALTLGVAVPVVQALGGFQRESPIVAAGLAWEI